ncbi:MAG TPA: hypothetical protein VLI07_18850 [Candidatus Binatus sp.]|nr:hypothetical protein [Candidatus Binatus sp.]
MATNRQPHSLKLIEFSDRELMNIVLDVEPEHGWVTTEECAVAMGLDHIHANNCVGVRFGWMRRYGVLERQTDSTKEHFGEWRLTSAGRKIALGNLSKEERALLSRISTDKLMVATGELTKRYHGSNGVAAQMMRRAWINGTAPR